MIPFPLPGFIYAPRFRSMRRYHLPYQTMNTRTLKIETAGDIWRGKVSPKIRLSGQWLQRAGFKPGNRVVVQISEPGILTLRFLEHTAAP
jgi:hypothetical protein